MSWPWLFEILEEAMPRDDIVLGHRPILRLRPIHASELSPSSASPRLADPLTRRPSAHPPAPICGVCSPALAE